MTRAQVGTLVAAALGLAMVFLDALIVNVALPEIQRDFRVGESALQWVVAAYSIGMAAVIMSSATVADRVGRRRTYVVGLSVFVVASCACGLAPDLGVLDVARGIQGMAAATVSVTSLALVSAAFDDPDQRARAIGMWTAIAATALALGPALGGVLTEEVGWRAVFFVTVPVGIAALVLTARVVVESRDEVPRAVDLGGQVLYVVAIVAFAWTVIEGPQQGWLSPSIVGAAAVFAIGLAALVAWELRRDEPMMDLRLFLDRSYALANVTLFTVLFCFYGTLLVLTQEWQNVREASPLVTGMALAPIAIGQVILAPRVGAWMRTVGPRRLIVAGLTVFLVALVVGVVGVQVHLGLVIACIVLTGVAVSFTVTPATAIAMGSVPPHRAGMASGILNAQRALGSAAGYAVLGTVLAGWLGASLDTSLGDAVPDRSERAAITAEVVAHADPRAYPAEVGPGRPMPRASTATRRQVAEAAEADFERGIQLALSTGALLVAVTLALCWVGLPRDRRPEPTGATHDRTGPGGGEGRRRGRHRQAATGAR